MQRRHSSVILSLALLLGACSHDEASPGGPSSISAPAVARETPPFWESGASVYWNSVARSLVVKYSASPFAAIRGYALLSHAQNASATAVEAATGNPKPSMTAAIARASVVALTYLFPAEAAALETLRSAELSAAGWPGDANGDVAAGDAIGQAIGAQMVTAATTDRFFAPWTGTVPTGPGLWFSSLNPPAPPVGAMFGQARTYYLTSGDQFRPPPPPAFGSAEYNAALAEVRHVSDTRTPEQLANALFWAFPNGTVTPPGYWNIQAANLVVKYHMNETAASHVLAVMNMAGFDAIVGCHDAKFTYWMIRPTQADPLITLAVGLPNFPSYPSDHACVSGAQSSILASFFPAEKARLDSLAESAAVSRLEGGLHYRFDNEAGLTLGRSIASFALSVDGPGRSALHH
ncbi:MAG TPA: vanadium-dependent haloperoxidase [Gemmatimonadaceae bacterium]